MPARMSSVSLSELNILKLTLSSSGRSTGAGGGGGSFRGVECRGEGSGFMSALPDTPLDTEAAPTHTRDDKMKCLYFFYQNLPVY